MLRWPDSVPVPLLLPGNPRGRWPWNRIAVANVRHDGCVIYSPLCAVKRKKPAKLVIPQDDNSSVSGMHISRKDEDES